MERREPPLTEEGWYALHDVRAVDWDAWAEAPERTRERALEEGADYLRSCEAVTDAAEGASAAYAVLGHKADLMLVHLRPTTADIDALERRFETTALARVTERVGSYVSVTEASGYSERARAYFEGELDEDSGLARYIRSRLYPSIPAAGHVCFYPMDKRRDPEYNWYDLPHDERAEHMESHGEIGRDYGGRVTQMITGSVGLDDWEWGVTLFADDLVDVKDLLYEMRFDPSTSHFAEFGPFYVGRRIGPGDLKPLLAGEPIPGEDGGRQADEESAAEGGGHPGGHPGEGGGHSGGHPGESGGHPGGHPGEGGGHPDASEGHPGGHHGEGGGHSGEEADDGTESGGRPPADGDAELEAVDDIAQRLATLGVREGEDYDPGDHALVLDSTADAEDLADAVDGLRGNFEHYDSHVLTSVRAEGGQASVVSVWRTESAADTAAGFLADLPGVTGGVRGGIGEAAGESGDEREGEDGAADVREALADLDVYAGQPHGEDVYALVLYSEADPADLADAVDDLRESFEHYDSHVRTTVYEDPEGGPAAVASVWETQRAADTAGGYLSDLPDVVGRADEGAGGPAEEAGFGTMGMFYTVKPEHREEFVEKFGEVGDLLADMEGHVETSLLHNREDENDMFIASQWRSKEDAMAFFRSDAFGETVSWGRDVLADRPRHVFLA